MHFTFHSTGLASAALPTGYADRAFEMRMCMMTMVL